MADRARCDLPYGHFGRGTYSPDDHTWSFERNLTAPSIVQLLGEPKILSEPSHQTWNCDDGASRKVPPSKRHQKHTKALADSHPHLRPASGLLSPLLRVSEAARDAVLRYDPLKGRLIASGHIQSYSRNRSIPVTAYITGEAGCDLCIVQVQKQKRGWDDDRSCWLEVPTLFGEQATWSSHAGPIQQVTFASTERSGLTFLAARLLTRTTIIRTTQVKRPFGEIQGSSIVSNILYDVTIDQTGGHTHADVAFNPWFPQQVALVDVAGKWTVLEFATRNMSQAERTWSGMARNTTVERLTSMRDGWARVSWVLNTGTLAVCTRESLELINIADDDPTMIEEVELGFSGAVSWVLDFLVLPGRRDHFCVLTTSHLLVYEISEATASKNSTRIKFKIRHYRNPEDLSLRLNSWIEEDEEDIGLLVYSSLLELICSYRFTLAEARPAVTVEHMDLRLHMTPTDCNNAWSNASVELSRVKLAHKPTREPSELLFQKTRFFSALIVREGLGAYQTLFRVGDDVAIPPLSWESKLATSSYRLSRHDFIAEDPSLDYQDPATFRIEPSARRSRHVKSQHTPSEQHVDLEQVANALQSPIGGTQPLANVLASIKSEVMRPEMDSVSPMRTLYSFSHAELDIGNMEDSAEALEQLLEVQKNQLTWSPGLNADMGELGNHLTLSPVEVPPSFGLGNLHLDSGLSSIYDCALSLWITPLSDTIPGRIRLARAKICGLVAVELALASRSLCMEESFENEPSQEQEQTQTQTQSQTSGFLPSGHGGLMFSQIDSSQPFPSSALPTPSHTPSITTASSHPSTFAAPELHRLSKYAAFSKPAPPALPRSLINVLSHWKVGEDINDYDWMSNSRRIAQQDEEADDDMTETERRRAQRRAERHIRRQRKEAAASRAQQLARSQAPEIFSASQPTGVRIESEASGIAGSSQFTSLGVGTAAASQVEAGRFGGRPAIATGKKRRRQGF